MDAAIDLGHEPAPREKFDYAGIVNNTVPVDRRTQWGNPHRIGTAGSGEQAVARHRADLRRRIRAGREVALEELACRCVPEPCPGHVLARAAAPSRQPPCRAEPPMGPCVRGVCWLPCVLFQCAMCARYSNPAGPPVAALPAARPKEV